jgi:hypothetical protein
LTESVSDEKIVISAYPSASQEKTDGKKTLAPTENPSHANTAETKGDTSSSHEHIVDRKTIIYETLVDPTVIKLNGEKLKTQIFTKFLFLRPYREDIQFVSINKYYEPFIVISGKYSIDYYRKSAYAFKLDKEVREVIVLNQQFKPEQSKDPYDEKRNMIKLDVEERITREFNASLVIDRSGQDIPPERLPSAPSERNPEKLLTECGMQEIPEDADLNIIQSRILKRPKDISRIVNEFIEVNERVVIYAPRFKVVYRNTLTGGEKTVEFDGVTGKRIYIQPNVKRVR